jgi:hypothetical protein
VIDTQTQLVLVIVDIGCVKLRFTTSCITIKAVYLALTIHNHDEVGRQRVIDASTQSFRIMMQGQQLRGRRRILSRARRMPIGTSIYEDLG